MQQALRETNFVPVDDYLELEEQSEGRSEYIDGVVYAMVGGTDRHNLIAGALYSLLDAHLSGPCQVFINDLKLLIKSKSSTVFYYPDIMVSCDPTDHNPRWRERPSVVIEILSPTTERTDRTEKLSVYSRIDALEDYVLIAQDLQQVEVYRRSNSWEREVLTASDTLTLPSLTFAAPVAQLYRRVTF
jgi:Uma2 family endonuclease